MIVKISPVVSSFSFGSADAVRLRLVGDNLADVATFLWQLGRLVSAVPATEDAEEIPEKFVADDSAAGNVLLSGEGYASWSGANAELPALLLPQIGLSEPATVNPAE